MRHFLVLLVWAYGLAHGGVLVAQDAGLVSGVLQKVDVQNGTITIRPGKGGAKEAVTFNLFKPDIEVVSGLGPVRLADLAAGHVVQLRMRTEDDVEAIRVEDPVIRGAVTAVDTEKMRVSVLVDDLSTKVLAVTAKSRIVQQGKDADLADVKVHQWVEITASLDGKAARHLELHAAGSRNGKISSGKIYGKILSLDSKSGTLLFLQNGKERLMSFAATESASVWLTHGRRPVEVLTGRPPLRSEAALLYLSPDRSSIKRIETQAPTLRCRVKAVNFEERKLTVEEGGAIKTWEMPADLVVMNGSRKVKNSEVRVEEAVDLLLSLDRSKLRGIALTVSR